MFGAFERMVAWRYLRARKGERFVSVTAAFSLAGIALGVAALIIVMAVMNGFRQDLVGRIIGPRGAAAGTVELKRRATGERMELSVEDAIARIKGG